MTIEILQSSWTALQEHLKRDAIIVVSADLDLNVVASQVVADHRDEIARLIENGGLAKPTPEQIARWDRTPDTPFRFVIAQPYVLIQTLAN